MKWERKSLETLENRDQRVEIEFVPVPEAVLAIEGLAGILRLAAAGWYRS